MKKKKKHTPPGAELAIETQELKTSSLGGFTSMQPPGGDTVTQARANANTTPTQKLSRYGCIVYGNIGQHRATNHE